MAPLEPCKRRATRLRTLVALSLLVASVSCGGAEVELVAVESGEAASSTAAPLAAAAATAATTAEPQLNTRAPQTVSEALETTPASVEGGAEGAVAATANVTAAPTLVKLGEIELGAQFEGVADNETAESRAARLGKRDTYIHELDKPFRWLCPLFRQTLDENAMFGKLVGYAVRLSDYDFLAHSRSVNLAQQFGQPTCPNKGTEPIMLDPPLFVDVFQGTTGEKQWDFKQSWELPFTPVNLYKLFALRNIRKTHWEKQGKGINEEALPLDKTPRTSFNNCFGYYLLKESERKYRFVRQEISSITDCTSWGLCSVRLGANNQICEAHSGMPILCDGALSYITFAHPWLEQDKCPQTIKAVSIGHNYKDLEKNVERKKLCWNPVRCYPEWRPEWKFVADLELQDHSGNFVHKESFESD